MSSPSSESRVTSSADLQMPHPGETNNLTTAGPSPSLWPEVSHQPYPSRETDTQASASRRTLDTPGTSCAVSYSCSNTDEVVSGSTLPTSNSSSSSNSSTSSSPPPPRPIDITATPVFEPHYPRWHSYPPVLPTTFDTPIYVSSLKGPSFDLTDKYLEQSRAFQRWVEQKDAERIQLRYTPTYKKLVEDKREQQHMANRGSTPEDRTKARMRLIHIEKLMKKERERLAPADRQCISEIEKECVAIGSIDSHQQTVSRQRQLSSTPPVEPKTTLSKVERLLGADGSCPSISSWTQRCQSIPIKPSYEESNSIQQDGGKSNAQSPQPPQPVESLPVTGREMTQTTMAWPDKPFPVLIPDWFPVAMAQRNIEMEGRTVEECYNNLLNYIYRLEMAKSQEEYKKNHPDAEGIIVKDYTWDKSWHDPCDGWRHEKQRKMGGWWKCNKGPNALPAERRCRLCSPTKPAPPATPPAQLLNETMGYIREAMAAVAERDKEMVLKSFPRSQPRGVDPSGPLVDETLKMWAHHDNPLVTTELGTIPIGTRQPWINYNPLRGIDDTEEILETVEEYLKLTVAEHHEQEQPDREVASKGKGKELCVS
ncbi:hypothetical protein NPX13_g5083 [Xylaria arbuscula]|uniref:Uncharacterized protein n=1 Tax=Xylaria arbuscula TaxID=114810 RepID=A0A9W8NFI0_9PEZI|nr:hypothetical protein NPX13_g5083 [Xylaria arbuscula]